MAAGYTVTREIGGMPRTFVFKFGTMRRAEQELGRPLPADMAAGNIGFDAISAIFWAALQPSLAITRDGSDDLIEEMGVADATVLIMDGLGRVFGQDHDQGAAEADAGDTGGDSATGEPPRRGKKRS